MRLADMRLADQLAAAGGDDERHGQEPSGAGAGAFLRRADGSGTKVPTAREVSESGCQRSRRAPRGDQRSLVVVCGGV